ncbi:unnamed protein product [Meloidogyne enterolobii]|uniref:Uncharacterized protein n=1 Tax=Meloidogyne enterolobii TaxID=390850 RepID=A0ACB0ZX34_MELEN
MENISNNFHSQLQFNQLNYHQVPQSFHQGVNFEGNRQHQQYLTNLTQQFQNIPNQQIPHPYFFNPYNPINHSGVGPSQTNLITPNEDPNNYTNIGNSKASEMSEKAKGKLPFNGSK